jgi:hypothetical protein
MPDLKWEEVKGIMAEVQDLFAGREVRPFPFMVQMTRPVVCSLVDVLDLFGYPSDISLHSRTDCALSGCGHSGGGAATAERDPRWAGDQAAARTGHYQG